jgi:hypothetical protein
MAKTKRTGVPVSVRAVVQRINRRLKRDLEALKATRGDRGRRDLGDYYHLDMNHNRIMGTHIDPEAFARELGILAAWERMVEEDR